MSRLAHGLLPLLLFCAAAAARGEEPATAQPPLSAATSANAAGAADAANAADTISPAEALLFERDHLAGVALPAQLKYAFRWNGEGAFEDRILMSVDAARRTQVDYLEGPRHMAFPDVEEAHGNPLLLYFLEHDLREMQRLTGGSVGYFRRFVRRAFADPKLAVETLSVQVNGQTQVAQRIRIEPFRADPQSAQRYPKLAGKRYEFVLCAAVPGEILSLASIVPGEGGRTQRVDIAWSGVAPL